jgi:hypothetical protein
MTLSKQQKIELLRLLEEKARREHVRRNARSARKACIWW